MTEDEWKQVKLEIEDIKKIDEPCSLCGGQRDRVCTFQVINTHRPRQKLWIAPLCKTCAEDPELKTKMIEIDFLDECSKSQEVATGAALRELQ